MDGLFMLARMSVSALENIDFLSRRWIPSDSKVTILSHIRNIQLAIPRSLLRGQSFLVPSGGWRTRGTRQ